MITRRLDLVTPDDLGVVDIVILGLDTLCFSSFCMNAALTLSKETLQHLLLMFTYKYLSYFAMILYGPS